MKLRPGESVIGMVVIEREGAQILTISANGYGKRTDLDAYRRQSRGGLGILTLKTTEKTGPLVAIKSVTDEDDLMISTEAGIMIRMPVRGIATYGRNAQGVRVISLKDGDRIADVTRVVVEDDEEADASDGVAETPTAAAA
jgi:DNA gyrase subunit A